MSTLKSSTSPAFLCHRDYETDITQLISLAVNKKTPSNSKIDNNHVTPTWFCFRRRAQSWTRWKVTKYLDWQKGKVVCSWAEQENISPSSFSSNQRVGNDFYLQGASCPEACKKDERTSSIWEGRRERPSVSEDDLPVTAHNPSFIVSNRIFQMHLLNSG